jgi:hypothetical protein
MGTEILCDGQFHVSREGRTLILQAHIASHETCTARPHRDAGATLFFAPI